MILAGFSLGDPSIAQTTTQGTSKKPPPKRTVEAIADRKLAPEPR